MSYRNHSQESAKRSSSPARPWAILLVVAAVFVAVAETSPAAVRVECVGDSITAGYTDNPNWNVPFEFGYRSGLYTRMKNAGYDLQFVGGSAEPWNNAFGDPSHGGTYKPSLDLRDLNQDNHRGYGGWGTAAILSNIGSWLTADNPDVVLLMIGINDGDSTTTRNNLNSIVQTIVTSKPNADVIVAQITPMADGSKGIVNYNTYIRDTLVPTYQAQGKHVTTVDQYANLLTGGSIDASLFSNGINHPNAVAYDRMAQTWFAGIQAVHPVPEPGTLVLLGAGLLGLFAYARRKRAKANS